MSSLIAAYEMSWYQTNHGVASYLLAKGQHQNWCINFTIKENVPKKSGCKSSIKNGTASLSMPIQGDRVGHFQGCLI